MAIQNSNDDETIDRHRSSATGESVNRSNDFGQTKHHLSQEKNKAADSKPYQPKSIAMAKSRVLFISVFLLFASPLWAALVPSDKAKPSTAAAAFLGAGNSKTAVYIVTLNPTEEVETESLHIGTLSSLLGSEEAAKEALVYSYKSAVNGFSARLTREQATVLAKQPGVLNVMPNRIYYLHTGMIKLPNMGGF